MSPRKRDSERTDAEGRDEHAIGHAGPIGPYSHVAKVGSNITIGGTAGSDLDHVIHVNVFLAEMSDFDAMNTAYVSRMGAHRPARTVIGVRELPKPGVRVTMNLTAVTRD